MSKKSEKYQKWAVIAIGALFLTSMAGIALNSSDSGRKSTELPETFVLSEDLTDEQRSAAYGGGCTVVVFRYDSLCGAECAEVRGKLEALTSKYQPYVYLVSLLGESNVSISVGNYFGEDDFGLDEVERVEDEICEVIARHPGCIERSALSAVFNYNTTPDETVNETEEIEE